jgi:hypothetical protein
MREADPALSPFGLQREAAAVLYARLIQRKGPATVDALADRLGICHSSITRQCTGDIPVQLRTVPALLHLDEEGGRDLLDLLARSTGVRWTDEPAPDSCGVEAVRTAWAAVGRAAELQASIASAAQDHHFDASERQAVRERLRAMEHECKRLAAQLDALEPAPKVQAFGAGRRA